MGRTQYCSVNALRGIVKGFLPDYGADPEQTEKVKWVCMHVGHKKRLEPLKQRDVGYLQKKGYRNGI